VAAKECDYAIVPIENSLGGSIHENYDLMLRYDLTIVAEHDFRVRHCLLTKPGLDVKDIEYAISHPQALSQCDNYLRARGIVPKATYDTAGSAKMICKAIKGEAFGRELPEGCTPENTAAIASNLAGETFELECKEEGIEDDDSNFTRFLLLGRRGVVQYLNKKIPCKTSLVFTLPNSAGALYKSLACFSLRDIDMSKIESRPMSAALLNYLRFRNTVTQLKAGESSLSYGKELPRFRYCFYLDILASELDEGVQNALHHLREQSDYCRILGSYPAKSRLVGPVAEAVDALNAANAGKKHATARRLKSLPSDDEEARQLNIGFVGYGSFGQYLSKQMSSQHKLRCTDPVDKSKEAEEAGVEYFPSFEMSTFLQGLDVVVIAVPMIELEETMESLPLEKLRNKLIVEVCPLNVYPRTVLTRMLPPETDILCANPMVAPGLPLDGVPVVYEKVRISDTRRADCFLSVFERARCQMVEMAGEDHDAYVADAEFVTHLTGRLLDRNVLPVSPVSSREYAALCDLAEMTTNDTFDMFYGMFKYNDRAKELLNQMRENLASVERKLAAKEAYLEASAEMKNTDRQKLLAECRMLLKEMAKSSDSSSIYSTSIEEKEG
jgi:prephenate dehydratase/prephenate dehydrogenase